MALVHVRTITRTWFRDRESTESFTQIDYPVTTDFESLVDEVNGSQASVIQALTDCALCETEIEFRFHDSTEQSGDPATREEAGHRGSFFFQTDTSPEDRYVIDIPALREELYIAPDYIVIDTSNSDVAAFVTAVLADGAADIVNPFSIKPISLTSAFKRLIPIEDDRPSG